MEKDVNLCEHKLTQIFDKIKRIVNANRILDSFKILLKNFSADKFSIAKWWCLTTCIIVIYQQNTLQKHRESTLAVEVAT